MARILLTMKHFLYNEIWDGDRFSELSWFWNPDAEWILPAKCPENYCNGVVSSDNIEAAPLRGNMRKSP